jgi:arginine/lysine/ornithine decarboxylase
MLDQSQTPLLTALKNCANQHDTPFYAPGHKRGQGISPLLIELLGTQLFKSDLPELPELDNLFNPEGVIAEAENLAAETFGAEKTWFLVNGSTSGIMAAILAICGTGDKILVPRNAHQSVISGLILSGAIAIFLQPEYNLTWDLTYSITPEAVAQTLEQHPDTKAVLIVYPTYQGICGNIAEIAKITHEYNIPLIVDEAHGAHFNFHPDLPISALKAGADLTIQSTHKVLGSLTQSSMLHVQGNRIDRDRLSQTLQFVQSTSPNYILLASLDAARQQMATQGYDLIDQTLSLAKIARTQISQIQGLASFGTPDFEPTAGCVNLDITRLTIQVSNLGISGYEADEILRQQFHVTAELPSLHHLTFIISLGNTQTDIQQLINALKTLAVQHQAALTSHPVLNLFSTPHCSPSTPPYSCRDAFFAQTEKRPLQDCLGLVSAEIICPYPPGIPVLMPGEIVTSDALKFLQQVIALGGKITGCTDPNLQQLKIVKG